jgi:hypothetical protein
MPCDNSTPKFLMPKERNKAVDYREKAYHSDTKAINNLGVANNMYNPKTRMHTAEAKPV